jgi:hypothetical protein
MRTSRTGIPSCFGRWLHKTFLLCIVLGLASCGGSGSQGTGSNQAISDQAMQTEQIAAAAPSVAVTGITKVSETRVSRTVYDYVFQVTVKNNGSGLQGGVTATLTGVGTGTTIIDGAVQVGDLAAGATVTPQDTITLRQDRTFPFNAAALVWSMSSSVDQTIKVQWNGMTNALLAGDKQTAMSYLTDDAKFKYGPVFDVLMPEFPQILPTWSPLINSSISASTAEYAVVTDDGTKRQLFYVNFELGDDGVWRLESM